MSVCSIIESINTLEIHTPREIVAELDKYIIGQQDAKKSVANALRNRERRKMVEPELQEDIIPKNILMIGPTGVGKTEIARRLAKLTNSPFIKVEATKFTEVGYVGRDVESIIRDLMEIAISKVRRIKKQEVEQKAKINAEIRVVEALVGKESSEATKVKFLSKLREGAMDNDEIEIEVSVIPSNAGMSPMDIPGMPGGSVGVLNIGEMLGKSLGINKTKPKKMPIKDAVETLMNEEFDKLLDEDLIVKEAKEKTESEGIVFIDEIDKVTARNESRTEVNREGVQRDLLPLLEGTDVPTKYGTIRTDHILFICSGAFHLSKPSDLLPEFQGRIPIRVELKPLSKDDMVRILKEPKSSLIKQYIALMATDEVDLEFTDDSIEEIALLATEVNKNVENIGARRLHTIMEKLLEDISFDAGDKIKGKIKIDKEFVYKNLGNIIKSNDLSKFIL